MHRCTISHIDPDSPLRHAAHPGDRLVSINGNPITDVLDYRFYMTDEHLENVRIRTEMKNGKNAVASFKVEEEDDEN